MTTPPADGPRKRYHHGDLANALVEAAVELVQSKGVEGFSLREAARTVGVDPAAAYRHFKDKSALLAAVARQGFVELAKSMERALGRVPKSPDGDAELARFRAVGRAYVQFARKHPSRFRVMFGPYGAGNGGDPQVRGVGPSGLDPYELLHRSLRELHAAGIVAATPEQAALPAWSAVHGLASLVIEGAIPLSTDLAVLRAADTVIDCVIAGLVANRTCS